MKAMREAQAGTGSTWRQRLGGMISAKRTVRTLLTATRMKRVDTSKVTFEDGVAIWQQGDMSLYTDAAVQKRAAVRHDAGVLKYLHVWWETALRSMRRSLQSGRSHTHSEHGLSKEEYISMMKKIYKVMIDEYDEDDALECAEEDWEKDAQGSTALSRELFCDAIFELADVWTRTCESQEYIDFLSMLHAAIAVLDGDEYIWKGDDAICFDPKFDVEGLGASERVTPSPRRSLSPSRKSSTRRQAGASRGFAASGMHWQRLRDPSDDSRFSERTELINAALGATLLERTADGSMRCSFTGAEWEGFAVSGLRYMNYIVAKGVHFVPSTDLASASEGLSGIEPAQSTAVPSKSPLVRVMGSLKSPFSKGTKTKPKPPGGVKGGRVPRPDPGSRAPYFAKTGARLARGGARPTPSAVYREAPPLCFRKESAAAPAAAMSTTIASEYAAAPQHGRVLSFKASVVNVSFGGPSIVRPATANAATLNTRSAHSRQARPGTAPSTAMPVAATLSTATSELAKGVQHLHELNAAAALGDSIHHGVPGHEAAPISSEVWTLPQSGSQTKHRPPPISIATEVAEQQRAGSTIRGLGASLAARMRAPHSPRGSFTSAVRFSRSMRPATAEPTPSSSWSTSDPVERPRSVPSLLLPPGGRVGLNGAPPPTGVLVAKLKAAAASTSTNPPAPTATGVLTMSVGPAGVMYHK